MHRCGNARMKGAAAKMMYSWILGPKCFLRNVFIGSEDIGCSSTMGGIKSHERRQRQRSQDLISRSTDLWMRFLRSKKGAR